MGQSKVLIESSIFLDNIMLKNNFSKCALPALRTQDLQKKAENEAAKTLG